MKNNLKILGTSQSFAILLASCGSSVYVEKDKQTDFSTYRSFAWADNHGETKKDHRSNDLTEGRIKEAISDELEKTVYNPYTRQNATIYYPIPTSACISGISTSANPFFTSRCWKSCCTLYSP